jgi:spore maturation protein CgeB
VRTASPGRAQKESISSSEPNKAMRILFLGEISSGQTSLMRMRAFGRLDHVVHGVNTVEPWKKASWLARQVQRRFGHGGVIEEINKSVLTAARDFRPDLVWAEKQEFLRVETFASLRQLGARLVHFTPDPYFSLAWKRTPLMDAAMGEFDFLVYCKSYERPQYAALGKPIVYMPLGYCDEVHRPLPSSDMQWSCAVGFLGGWEPRREYLLHSVAAAGLDLKMRGVYWEFLRDGKWTLRRQVILKQLAGSDPFRFHRDEILWRAWQGGEIYGDDYARALTSAKIGLGLLRKVCPDQHTTRTFEIPACGSMLLADRTGEHRALFDEGREAEFFASTEELVDKAKFYCRDESARLRVAGAGFERCVKSKYAYIHRLAGVLGELARI